MCVLLLWLFGALPVPDDLRPLRAAAEAGLKGPDACVALVGQVTQRSQFGILGKDEETHAFGASLDHGRWTYLTQNPLTDANPDITTRFTAQDGTELRFIPPLLGDGGRATDGASLTGALLELLSREVETESASPTTWGGGEAWRLDRTFATRNPLLGKERANEAAVWITPDGPRARRWSITTELPLRLEGGVVLRDVEVVLEVDADGVPTHESLSGAAGLAPFTGRIARDIVYTNAGACAPAG